jgi:ankyrin repeat protein
VSANLFRQTPEAFIAAILADDVAAVAKLLETNADLTRSEFTEDRLFEDKIFHWLYARDTALHLAAAGYRTAIVDLLLENGADPNSRKNKRKSGPLHYAADGLITGSCWNETGQVATLRTLISSGAEINAPDQNGAAPLHRAVRNRCAAAVEYLLLQGADPCLKNKAGSTPFHLAVMNTGRGGSGEPAAKEAQRLIIRTFLAHGVKPALKDGGGKSVLESAQSNWIRQELAGGS